MEGMKTFPDGYFDLAVVDPPYGLGKRTTDGGTRKNTQTRFMDDIRRTNWDDSIPSEEYFRELKRVAANWIIWGANYFPIHTYRTAIVWDKMTYPPTMSRVEIAAASFDSPAKLVQINSNQPDRMHPTQKPVKLYDWIFANYAAPGMRVLDTHMGSGSIAIAAHYAGIHLTAYEIDADYFHAAKARIARETSQAELFSPQNSN
jgi:site-specific DNA-methyltransferase (adenine-specific)